MRFQTVTQDDNSNVLQLNSEPVVSSVDSLAEKSPTLLESPQPSIPSELTVQQPVLDSAAETPTTSVSWPMSPEPGDGLVQQSTSDVVHSSTCNISASTDNVQTPEHITVQHEQVIPPASPDRRPSGPLLLDLKRERARKRQELLLQHNSQSPNANRMGLPASGTNGAVVNGVESASPPPATDNVHYVGTRHRYSNRYEITAPDEREKCCVVM